MHDLINLAARLHKQRAHDLMEEARIERLLTEKKNRQAVHWQQRRLQRQRISH